MKPKSPSNKDLRLFLPDTNALWHETKDVPVAPAFSEFVSNECSDHNVQIVLPEVVFGELLYQQTTSATEALHKINKGFKTLSGIASRKYTHRVSEDRVRKDVLKKLETWIGSCGAWVVETPIQSIDWNRLIQDALWRKPPFTEDKKTEKGFRDSLILETVVNFAKDNPSQPLDFVSNDGLLRESVRMRTKGTNVSTFESLDDYSSHLRLLDQKLTEEFVSAISQRAAERFFTKSGRPDLWASEGIAAKIKEKFSDKLEAPGATAKTVSPLLKWMQKGPAWRAETEEKVRIGRPSFLTRAGKNIYRWNSKVVFVQFFRNVGQPSTLLAGAIAANELRIRYVIFNVTWSSKVGDTGRFSDCTLESIEHEREVFRVPSDDEINRYGPVLEPLGDAIS